MNVPSSKRDRNSRYHLASNPKPDWIHSVIAKAVLSLALTVVWKLSYAMKDGLLPIAREKCGLTSLLYMRPLLMTLCFGGAEASRLYWEYSKLKCLAMLKSGEFMYRDRILLFRFE